MYKEFGFACSFLRAVAIFCSISGLALGEPRHGGGGNHSAGAGSHFSGSASHFSGSRGGSFSSPGTFSRSSPGGSFSHQSPPVGHFQQRAPSFSQSQPHMPSFTQPRQHTPSLSQSQPRMPSFAQPRQPGPSLSQSQPRMPSFTQPQQHTPSLSQSQPRLSRPPAFQQPHLGSPSHLSSQHPGNQALSNPGISRRLTPAPGISGGPAHHPAMSQSNRNHAYQHASTVYRNHPSVAWHVQSISNSYRDARFNRIFAPNHLERIQNHHARYYDYYRHYYRHGFYGGYYYPFRPCHNIHSYFSYPVIFWFFVAGPQPVVYSAYYPYAYSQSYYDGYTGDAYHPVTPPGIAPFPFAEDFFPTDSLRDMGIEVSGMPFETQANFREGMIRFTSALQQEVANIFQIPFTFSSSDIVITHYENQQGAAIRVAGFINRSDQPLAFEGLIDLVRPAQSMVLVTSRADPSNSDIDRLGGFGGNRPEVIPPPAPFVPGPREY